MVFEGLSFGEKIKFDKKQQKQALKENRGRHHKELIEDEKIQLIEFLKRSDITYTNPTGKDYVHTEEFNLVTTKIRVIICLKNVQFVNRLKLLMI